MSVTIRDVARAADVSVATVSRVFNGKGQVRDSTREHVRRVASQLGYLPNEIARSLSNGRTSTLGVILPVPHGEFFSEIIRGLDEAAQRSEYHLLISSSHHRLEDTEAALRVLRGRVDGLVIMSPHIEAGLLMERIRAPYPVVFISSEVQAAVCDAFVVQNYEGGRAVTRHLVEEGHRRIAVIKGPDNNLEVRERLRGYHDALAEAGLEPDAALEFEAAFTQESGYVAARQIIQLDERPTAVFAFNDYMAIGALRAFHEEGLAVPQDVALAGFDGIPSSLFTCPPLTTVNVPAYDLGRRVMQRLIAQVDADEPAPAEAISLPTALEVRASTRS